MADEKRRPIPEPEPRPAPKPAAAEPIQPGFARVYLRPDAPWETRQDSTTHLVVTREPQTVPLARVGEELRGDRFVTVETSDALDD